MAQIQTQNYASNIQSAEQKFAQAANSLKMKISKALSEIRQNVSKWTSSPYLANTISIQEVKDRNLVKTANSAFRSFLPVF